MKFVLILSLCSFVTNNCFVVAETENYYKDWNTCMTEALVLSKEIIQNITPEEINKLRLATKYICLEYKEEGTEL